MSRADNRDHWEALARADPLWAVYVRADTKGGRWDVDEFLATGEDEVSRSWQLLESLGIRPPRGVTLDFGSGVGRLSRALARRVEHVLGLDVSETMVAEARRLCASTENVSFVVSDSPWLPVRSSSIAVVYSSLVLQHLRKDLAEAYVREFLRVMRPDGIAVIQVASRPRASVKGAAFRFLPAGLNARLQTGLLGYPAPMLMQAMSSATIRSLLAECGAAVVAEVPDTTYGGHWHYLRLVVAMSAAGAGSR